MSLKKSKAFEHPPDVSSLLPTEVGGIPLMLDDFSFRSFCWNFSHSIQAQGCNLKELARGTLCIEISLRTNKIYLLAVGRYNSLFRLTLAFCEAKSKSSSGECYFLAIKEKATQEITKGTINRI